LPAKDHCLVIEKQPQDIPEYLCKLRV